jgi:translation initiation factor 2 beta subunit (eIF-2beta)/eIF-5
MSFLLTKTNQINIRGNNDVSDPFYRYKMDQVEITKQGVKFAFVNIDTICLSLSRDPNHMVSFLKKHFGSAFEYKNNTATTTKKDLTKNELQTAVFKYIEENVLCKKCKNPETEYVKERKKILLCCKACSHRDFV